MPYIKQSERKKYFDLINKLVAKLKETKDTEGHLNYVITKLIDGIIEKPGYAKYNAMIGVLECAKQEYYRRVLAKYEDKKIKESGDVYKKTKGKKK